MVGVIIVAALAVLFVALVWARAGHPENEGASLGHNAPWPESVLGPSVHTPPPGSPESLESHSGGDWVDEELRSRRHQRNQGGG